MANAAGFAGVITPVLTPFRDDLTPDADRFIDHCKWLLQNGCHALTPFGTTSEANSLAAEERMALLEALVEGGIDPALLMVGNGTCSITETVKLTTHLVELGCGGVLMLPPFYYKGVSDDGLFRHFDEVIQRVGDDRLKVYLYHIPPQAVVGFSLDLIGRLIRAYPKTVVGLKDSSGDWANTDAILKSFAADGFRVFPGSEMFLLDGLRGGGVGCIAATANINPDQVRQLYDRWESKDADELQANITKVRKSYMAYPVVPALKSVQAHYRRDPAWANARPPFVNISQAQQRQLIADIEAAGYAYPGAAKLALAGE